MRPQKSNRKVALPCSERPSQNTNNGKLSCPLLLKHAPRNARSFLLDPMAFLVQVSSTPSEGTQNGGSPQLRAGPRRSIGRRPHRLTLASISWTLRARQKPFHLLIR